MIKNYLSMLIGGFLLFIGVYMLFILGNDKFSSSGQGDGVNPDVSGKNLDLLTILTFLIIVGFIVGMVMFGENIIGLNLRYAEPFVGGDQKEEFLSSIICSKKLDKEKMFCSKEYKDSLFSDLVSIDQKIDYLKKEFKKIKKGKRP